MTTHGNYIMKEQVENPIPAIMAYRATTVRKRSGKGLYLLSIATLTLVYLLTMIFSVN